ncbi:hypothetical protein [Mesorhizobium muleiense]|uniref:Uncharacterized protein n=1 Tax=Mesorhizobium muleiense TaxID=1004279 RepID=A0A1G8LCK8_9HYPH|nr:hypothetical protein [Mesorhizobium muleiense]MCF6100355.1 hypothetical protein [Mesorhizobium muleiense]SDI53459.1 hypothetical protein SAMN05428953_102207 [Mesorhizobium muleiense]
MPQKRKLKLTVRRVTEALQRSAGLMTVTAKRLRCARSTLYEFCAAHPELAEVRRAVDAEIGDLAESQLINGIRRGDMRAVTYYLSHKCKDRGYVFRQEVSGPNNGPVEVDVNAADARQVLAERLFQIASRMTRPAEVEEQDTKH